MSIIKCFALFFTLFIQVAFSNCFGYQILPLENGYICEIYAPEDKIPVESLEEARQMYYEAYLYPPLHSGIPLNELKINQNYFSSYEEYIDDMFRKDFASYGKTGKPSLHYLQLRLKDNGPIVGVCVALHREKYGYYYIDHIGINGKFRKQGLGTQLLKITLSQLSDCVEISLDTRVFNFPAQAIYEKFGFRKSLTHPSPEKQHYYFHYKLTNPFIAGIN